MSFAALITWLITAFGGLYLLVIWLIEYDVSAPGGAISRLPRPVIPGHVLLATSGLIVWIIYLIEDRYILAWVALSTLFVVALLGLTMLGRWIVVRRALAGAGRGSPSEELAGARPPRRMPFPRPDRPGPGPARWYHVHPGIAHRPRSGRQLTGRTGRDARVHGGQFPGRPDPAAPAGRGWRGVTRPSKV